MVIIQSYLTNTKYYKRDRSIKVQGLLLHSVGVPQPNPKVFIKSWNREDLSGVCVHGFIGEEEAHITLPIFDTPGIAKHAPHGASGPNGSVNDTHIGIEMCEPSQIKYIKGATFTCSDIPAARAFVEKTTKNAVELFAKLCLFHNLDPLKDGVIISHAEGYKRGIASGHGDPEHLWDQLGMNYNMNKFRRDVYKAMQNGKMEDSPMNKELEEFKALFREMRKELQDNDGNDWSKEARDWAMKTGIIQGTSSKNFNGAWEDFVTREQLVTLLYRLAKLLGEA